jgi:hypothetical protein
MMGHLPCPGGKPSAFPNHDIDGDPRTATTLDCGADEYVP